MQTRTSHEDEQAVRKAAAQFYTALNAMLAGDPNPLKEVYSHADDVTYMGAAGDFRIGWDQVYADWQAQADMVPGGQAAPVDIHVTVGQDMAVTQNYTRGEVKNQAGKFQKTLLRETCVFRQEDGKWKMIAHHADALPFLVEWRASLA